MTHLIRVTALQAFDYEGRALDRGDTLDVSPVIAATLRRQGRIALDSDLDPHASARLQRQAAPDGLPKRRRYRRRDLTAED